MDDKTVKTALILSAYDRMSRVVNDAVNKSIQSIRKFKESSDRIAEKGLSLQNFGSAVMGSAALQEPIRQFAELEDGAARLKTVLMDINGVPTDTFNKINAVSLQLGNQLPGNTNDFYNMFSTMIQGGMSAQNIINGTGKAAAYLAVQLKLPYDEVGAGVSKLREAAGVADTDMMKFLDTIQRTTNVGVKFDEMQMAFSRSAGQLKFLGLQGLKSSQDIAALYAMLIKSGATGETVGTGISAAMSAIFDKKKMAEANAEAAKLGIRFEFLDKKGNFKGIENFIAQFGKLKGLTQDQISQIITPIFGATGQDAQFIKTISSGGIGAFREMQARMNSQASLQQRVNVQLGTLKSKFEATAGTAQNLFATIGSGASTSLKKFSDRLNDILGRLDKWFQKHPRFASIVGWGIIGVGGLAAVAGTLGITLGVVAKVASFASSGLMILGNTVKAVKFGLFALRYTLVTTSLWTKIATAVQWLFNASWYGFPVVWIVAGIAAVVAGVLLMIKYWKPITEFFKKLWEGVKEVFRKTWDWIKGLFNKVWEFLKGWGKYILIPFAPFIAIPMIIIQNWDKIIGFFTGIGEKIRSIWNTIVKWISGIGKKFYEAGKNLITQLWNGIKALINKPVETFKNMVQKVRNMLPFSPAKEGPLKDIHRVRIIETIAQSMKPAPLINAMHGTLSQALTIPATRGARSGGGFTYAPVVNIHGGATATDKAEFMKMLQSHGSEIMRMMSRWQDSENRKSFSS